MNKCLKIWFSPFIATTGNPGLTTPLILSHSSKSAKSIGFRLTFSLF